MIWDTIAAMPWPHLAAFITGGLVLNFAPGQDVFFATACGLQGGPRAGALAGLGVGMGVLVHVTLTTIGLGAVIAAHPGALTAIKWLGAGYLLLLAWKSWTAGRPDPTARGAVRRLAIQDADGEHDAAGQHHPAQHVRQQAGTRDGVDDVQHHGDHGHQ